MALQQRLPKLVERVRELERRLSELDGGVPGARAEADA
jgi:hypothetical protein